MRGRFIDFVILSFFYVFFQGDIFLGPFFRSEYLLRVWGERRDIVALRVKGMTGTGKEKKEQQQQKNPGHAPPKKSVVYRSRTSK